ncbi:MAG TPA: ABC transporter permease [Anaerolineae bacterium]|nr:ABC transporter permease [Anaerolineae bacterium]
MTNYIIRRLLFLPVILFGVTILIFGILQLLDPTERAALYVKDIPKNPNAVQELVKKYGLDRPIYEQYFDWVGKAIHGDLGWSRTAQRPVLEAIIYYFPATVELSLWAILPIVLGGVWLGVRAAVNHNKPIDHSARLFAMVGSSFPTFVFALLMLMIFYANLQWFPPGRLDDWASGVVASDQWHQYTGMYTLDGILNARLDVTLDAIKHLFLPVVTLSYIYWALFLRVTRSSMLEVLNQDYIRTARAKGLSEGNVVNKHALRNALIPVATIGGLTFVGLLNGVIITETVYNFRGMGWYAATAALRLDVISVLGITLFTAILYVLANLVVDVLYGFLDPRVRIS